MSALPTWIGLIGGVIGILASVAAALVWLRMGMAKTTIDLYREDNDALRSRLQTVEEDRDALKADLASKGGRIAALEEERKTLRDLVTGKSAMDTLASVLEIQHNETKGFFREIKDLLTKMTDERRHG